MRPFVWKEPNHRWFARVDEVNMLSRMDVAEGALRTALVARDIINPGDGLAIRHMTDEDGGTAVYATVNAFVPNRIPAPGEPRAGDHVKVLNADYSGHCFRANDVILVTRVIPQRDGSFQVYAVGPDRWNGEENENYLHGTEYQVTMEPLTPYEDGEYETVNDEDDEESDFGW